MSDLTARLLAKPVGPEVPPRQVDPTKDFTRSLEISGDNIDVTVNGLPEGSGNEGTALQYLIEEGQDPSQWEVTHFRKIKYGAGMESVKCSYKRVAVRPVDLQIDMDYLIKRIKRHRAKPNRPQGEYGAIVALGDMQFGKVDGDGVEGTVDRTIEYLNQAANEIAHYQSIGYDIGHIHVALLGDHGEGYQSQGGANAARTVLGVMEQFRLGRRCMYHAAETFAPMAQRVSLAAVPGNHGEPVRIQGKGIVRYDDSLDTEALIAVQEGLSYNPDAYGHVEFYVPDSDELTVVMDVAGTKVGHVHGHMWRPGKHIEWWRGQAFHSSGLQQADLLLAGHLHHLLIEDDGPRRFIQVPALESESTWWRHRKGSVGNPGIVLALTKNGRTNQIGVIQ